MNNAIQFDFDMFCKKLSKNPNISTIKTKKLNNKIIEIIFSDGFMMYVNTVSDEYHNFYTFLNKDFPEYYYYGCMPHDNLVDLYAEINRMCRIQTRKKQCKSSYFKF